MMLTHARTQAATRYDEVSYDEVLDAGVGRYGPDRDSTVQRTADAPGRI